MEMQFDIQNPIHYTVANNHDAVYDLITKKYGLLPPVTPQETVEACDYALQTYGEKFANDLAQLHPDKEALLRTLGHYGTCCSSNMYSNIDGGTGISTAALQAELTDLERRLAAGEFVFDYDKQKAVDRIAQLKTMLGSKTGATAPAGTNPAPDKVTRGLLIGVAAMGLLFLGSKLLK